MLQHIESRDAHHSGLPRRILRLLGASVLVMGTLVLPAGASSRPTGSGPKTTASLIYVGHFGDTYPTPQFIEDHIEFLEAQPFDGLAIYLKDEATPPFNLTGAVMTNDAFTYQEALDVMAPLANLDFENLTENLAMVKVIDMPPDFFDDWSIPVQNFKNLAQAAKFRGLKGLIFDNEQNLEPASNHTWGNHDTHLAHADEYDREQYQAQARLRGKQVMTAMIQVFPDIVFLSLHGPYISEPAAFDSGLPFPDWDSDNELVGAFFAGMMEAVTGDACCVDGGELYTLREASQFEASAAWRRCQMASLNVDCDFIPSENPDLRWVWADRTSISFGVYDTEFGGESMDATILRSTLANALRAADRYAWFYAETNTYLLPGSATSHSPPGAPDSWVEAIELARADAAAPGNLTIDSATPSSVTLSWTDNSRDDNGCSIERLSGGTWSEVATTQNGTDTTKEVTGLSANTTYSFRVLAFNGNGNTGYSNVVQITTPPSGSAAQPTNLTYGTVTSSSVTLSWTDNASNDNGVSIESLSGGTWSEVATTPNGTDTTKEVTGLSADTPYSFRVYAFNASGNSWYSNVLQVRTPLSGSAAPPSNLTYGAVTSSSLALSWTDNSTNANGFAIERLQFGAWYLVKTTPDAITTTFERNGLSAETLYSFRVSAFSGSGNSWYSNVVEVTTPPSGAPAQPGNLMHGTVTSTSVMLLWTDNATNENGVAIEGRQGGGNWTSIDDTPDDDYTSYSVTGLSANTSYSFRVFAFNASGNSWYSNVLQITTPPSGTPASPTNLTSSNVTSSSVTLSWTDNSSNENGFAIEWLVGGSWTSLYNTPDDDITSYEKTGLSANTVYRFRVRAFNGSGNSLYSNVLQVTTLN